jgi:NADH-quinone oxidoreductase subunit I
MKRAFREIFTGFGSLLTGMRITLEQFFKPQVTVHYPHESLTMPKRYRGHIVLVRDPETGKSLCVACKSCEKACPSDCIVVEGLKKEGEKRKSVTEFKLNFTTCSLCGSCVEACHADALQFSREYNLASTSKEAFYQIDLVKDIERPTGS